MENIPQCPRCGAVQKIVPAGISKRTGKPYQAFFACSANCEKHTQNAPRQNYHEQRMELDQFLTKTQFNDQLDLMRKAFKDMDNKITALEAANQVQAQLIAKLNEKVNYLEMPEEEKEMAKSLGLNPQEETEQLLDKADKLFK